MFIDKHWISEWRTVLLARDVIYVSVRLSVCHGSALWSRCMPGKGEGSSRAMLATGRPSCCQYACVAVCRRWWRRSRVVTQCWVCATSTRLTRVLCYITTTSMTARPTSNNTCSMNSSLYVYNMTSYNNSTIVCGFFAYLFACEKNILCKFGNCFNQLSICQSCRPITPFL